jgi:hypothetical protein
VKKERFDWKRKDLIEKGKIWLKKK